MHFCTDELSFLTLFFQQGLTQIFQAAKFCVGRIKAKVLR